MRVVAQVAKRKTEHPEYYCPARKCLYRTGDGSFCPRHTGLTTKTEPLPPIDDGSEDNWGGW